MGAMAAIGERKMLEYQRSRHFIARLNVNEFDIVDVAIVHRVVVLCCFNLLTAILHFGIFL